MGRGEKADENTNIAFIKDSVEKYRSKLLDTSRKNNLISFSHSERSRQHIRVIDELPDFIYKELLEGKKLTFESLPEEDQYPPDENTHEFRRRLEQAQLTDEDYLSAMRNIGEDEENAQHTINQIEQTLRDKIRETMGLPVWDKKKHLTHVEIAKKHGLNPDYEMPRSVAENKENCSRHTDEYIQTRLKPTEMVKKLSDLSSLVRSHIEESGVNTLYAVFGFLAWYEAENSEKPCISPLLLLQLDIVKERSKEGYTFYIQSTGEEPEVNLCLSERLQRDLGIQLPPFAEADSPEDYMIKVAEQIKETKGVPQKNNWRVHRFITIGCFHFSRLVMYHDLDAIKSSIANNKLVQKLLGGSEESTADDHAGDYDIDTPEVEKIVPLLITPADASQHSVLVDVMGEKDLTIQGPPGTGKSQTITNIIANALAKGKTVLFLAEKMAALNVVHERLSKAGLGPYCLELHSTKAKKTEIMGSLKERFELRSSKENEMHLSTKLEDFKRHRDCISEYVNVLNSKFGRQNKTVYDYLWAALRYKENIGDLLDILSQTEISFAEADLSESELTAHVGELEKIATLKAEADEESDQGQHPWRFINNFELSPVEQDSLKHLITQWKELLEKTQNDLKYFADHFKLPVISCSAGLESFLDNTEMVSDRSVDDLDPKIIANLNCIEKARALVAFTTSVHCYKSAGEKIGVLKDIPMAIEQISVIEKQTNIAKKLNIDTLSAIEINAEIKTLEEELNLWEKNLTTLLTIGECFRTSKNETLDNIYTLMQVLDDITAVPRDYLLLRTKDIIDETNTERLKVASNVQKQIHKLKRDFDLSVTGKPCEIRAHARILKNKEWFSFSYHKAKKYFRQVYKHSTKLNADEAANKLREIAEVKEQHQKVEQDTILQTLCNTCFDTDFEKLYRINEWAGNIRRNYPAGDEFTGSIQKWLLTAALEELDSVRVLYDKDHFIALKNKVTDTKEKVSFDAPVKEYLNNLKNRIKKLSEAKGTLQNVAASQNVTFAEISKDLPFLKQAEEAKIAAEKDENIKAWYGDQYDGVHTNIQYIERTACFVEDYLATIELKDVFHLFFNQDFPGKWQHFIEKREAIKKQYKQIKEQATKAKERSLIDLSVISDANSLDKIAYNDLIALFTSALNKQNSLSHWINLNARLKKSAQDIKGTLLAVYDKNNLNYKTLPQVFKYVVYNAIVCEIYHRYPLISSVKGMDLNQARNNIKVLDEEIMKLSQDKLCSTLSMAQPVSGIGSGSRNNWTEKALLEKEIAKQRRHISIRSLMKRAGKSIQKIKPCFLMSPLSVAQYLTHGEFTFDLLIIDEASQMRPEDALGAAARSRQIVVVGDQKQLPPTSFFQSDNDDDDEEDFVAESIMDMAISSFRATRMLNRHYRSRHESLIAFSNHHFYDKKLMLFPSPVKDSDDLGVKLEYIGGTYTAQSNMKEAQAITKATLDFMKKHPNRSLGIAAMNTTQRDLIETEMDRAFIDDSYAANYKEKWQNTLESFFVKNLENVQGDERDAIFISTVYGPDKNGTVMQRFGPINNVMGYRRLNVLFTRAKKNMVVFTSLKPEDIKISPTSSDGVKALKDFLTYANKGMIDAGKESHLEPESDFEIWVKEKLESIGCEVHPQVGVEGYRIDLGVKHPQYPYGYLMGIECDGATYHSSKSARERDVIRQQHLEGLGWRIYRIWSTDWFSNPTSEFEKLKNYIEELLNGEPKYCILEGDKYKNVAEVS